MIQHLGEIAAWGPCRGWRGLQDCPIKHPELFAMESNPVAGIYGHGQTEWYRTYAAAKARLESVPMEARWHGQRYGGQGDEPIRLSPVGKTLWKVIFKYSPTYWLEASTNAAR